MKRSHIHFTRVGHGVIVSLSLLLLASSSGSAQEPAGSIVGAWSWQTPSPSGPQRHTMNLGADSTFVRADLLANGTLLRSWGNYRASPAGENLVRFETQIRGYLPRTSCVQIPGFNASCRRVPTPPEMALTFTLSSPTTMKVDGVMLVRDDDSTLLQRQASETTTLTGQAPSQPMMQMPTAPQLHPYKTPYGPGASAADAYHAQNKSWNDQVMRGCYIAPDGTRWGCEQ